MAFDTPLSEEQIEEYYREGYVLVPGLAPLDVIDDVVEAAKQVQVTQGGQWTPITFLHTNPLEGAQFHSLLVHPRIVGATEQIFEGPARVHYGMVAIVPRMGGSGLQWHQDNMYTTLIGRALNVFIAMCDISEEMANLWVAPRSHLWGVQPSLTTEGHRVAADPPNGIPLPPLSKGDACIFDRNLLHRSGRNTTAQDRYAYAAQYHDDAARLASTGKKDPIKMRASELAALYAGR